MDRKLQELEVPIKLLKKLVRLTIHTDLPKVLIVRKNESFNINIIVIIF